MKIRFAFRSVIYLRKEMKLFAVFFVLSFLISCTEKESEQKSETPSEKTTKAVTRSNRTFLTDCKQLLFEARQMDSILLQETEVNDQSANKAVKAFNDYASYCHNDSLSPIFLIKSAQVSRAINKVHQARMSLHECVDKYPSFVNRPAALFLLAQTYDDSYSPTDEEKAKMLYQEIIEKYPESDWAASAKGAIKFLGKTDEQIMNELNRKSNTSKDGK